MVTTQRDSNMSIAIIINIILLVNIVCSCSSCWGLRTEAVAAGEALRLIVIYENRLHEYNLFDWNKSSRSSSNRADRCCDELCVPAEKCMHLAGARTPTADRRHRTSSLKRCAVFIIKKNFRISCFGVY